MVDGSDLAGAADDGLLAVGVVDDGNLAAFFEARGAHGMGDRWQRAKSERRVRRFVISTFHDFLPRRAIDSHQRQGAGNRWCAASSLAMPWRRLWGAALHGVECAATSPDTCGRRRIWCLCARACSMLRQGSLIIIPAPLSSQILSPRSDATPMKFASVWAFICMPPAPLSDAWGLSRGCGSRATVQDGSARRPFTRAPWPAPHPLRRALQAGGRRGR